MIAQHLQIPTLILIAPLLVWGIWLLSESSFDTWGTWMKPMRKSRLFRATKKPSGNNSDNKGFKETPQIRDLRSRSIFLNFAIGFSLVLLSYFFIFINPDFLAPVLSVVAIISLYLAYAHREPERIRAREKSDFEGELPTYMQLMTVLISAEISPAKAMDLLSRRSNSISGEKLRKVVVEIQNGSSVVQALDNLSRNYDSLILRRFVTGIVLAIERGSSLTPILIAQVKDARVARKNQILQRAGRAEISLMIPVVFLILPISILFALWPSYQQLGTFV